MEERFATDPGGTRFWPEEVRLKRAERLLVIRFDNGREFSLPAEYLRVESPSAEVQGHGPGQRQTVHGKARVGITGLEPVGNYAVRILFDDGHDSGIFSWTLLYGLGEAQAEKWAAYLAELERRGLSREPRR